MAATHMHPILGPIPEYSDTRKEENGMQTNKLLPIYDSALPYVFFTPLE
jgi:hypothetical protein